MENNIEFIKKSIKDKITNLIENNQLDDALYQAEEYFKVVNNDEEAYSILGVIFILKNEFEKAERVLKEGLNINFEYFDLHYNLAYVEEGLNKINYAVIHYYEAAKFCVDDKLKKDIEEKLCSLSEEHNIDLEDLIGFNEGSNSIKKVLFIQNVPCIRTNKVAKALRSRGIQTDIAYLGAHPSQVYKDIKLPYKNIYRIQEVNEMINFINESDYDILYSANEPDYLTVLFTATNKPIIHDTHDMMSLRGNISIEQVILEYTANVKSSGNIYVNPSIKDIAVSKFNIKDKPILTLHSYIEEEFLPSKYYEKLSKIDGEFHCVFEGGLSGQVGHHRYLEPVFLKLAREKVHVHLYGFVDGNYIVSLLAKSNYIHYEGNKSPQELMTEMTKYDFGLAIFNLTERNKTFLDTAFPNKIWDYLASGLPILFGDVASFRQFAEETGVGKVLNLNSDIKKQVDDVCNIKIEKDFLKVNGLLMNDAASDLIKFLSKVKEEYYKDNGNRSRNNNKYRNIVKNIREVYDEHKNRGKLEIQDIDKVASICFYGRSGSLFLLSLLDNHPNILMLPGDYLRFYYNFWNAVEEKYGKDIPIDVVVNEFFQFFPFIFDSRKVSEYFSKTGYSGDFGVRLGFTAMGENQDQHLEIDKSIFIYELKRVLRQCKSLNRKDFFKAIHISYFYALGKEYTSDIKPIIVYYTHNFDLDEPHELYEDFKDASRLCTVREPVQTFGSLIESYRRVLDKISVEQMGYLLVQTMYGGIVETQGEKSKAIKLEDLHNNPKETMERVCEFLSLPWSDTLLESTFHGLKWWNAKTSQRLSGFNSEVIKRKHEELFSDFDRDRLKNLLFKKYEAWEYGYYKKDYEGLYKELEEPFEFEKFIYYENDEERKKGREIIKNLLIQYWDEVNNNEHRKKEIKLLKR